MRDRKFGGKSGPANPQVKDDGQNMGALTRQAGSPFSFGAWQPEITALLDENHLVAYSDQARFRVHFASALAQFLGGLHDAEVCVLHGRSIDSIESLCTQLERCIPGPDLLRRIDGPGGITSLLRHREIVAGRRTSRFRYYVWNDADVLLKADRDLFGRVVDAIAGVAAEAEFVSDDLLFIQRALIIGGPMLELYAQNPTSQFNAWYDDGCGEPFWQVVTGIEKPPILRYDIDALTR